MRWAVFIFLVAGLSGAWIGWSVEGVRRMEVVSMNRVANEWKFGGFKRSAPK